MNGTEELQARRLWGAAGAWAWVETLLIFLIFFLFAGAPVPDVNEAHYLTKAKHYWNPEWCQGDLFLESKDAHLAFNWTFGWLTLLLPLPAVAWVGRIVTWALLAWSWQRLSFTVVPRNLVAVLSAGLFLCFLERCDLAGEWVVGGVEAKGFAFVLVLLGIESLVRGHWNRAWLLLGGAIFFHALVGGWSMVALALVWLGSGRQRPQLRAMAPSILLAVLLALPSLCAGLSLTWDVDPQIVHEANRIYVFERLPHHLAPHTFAPLYVKLPATIVGSPGYYAVLPSAPILRHAGLLVAWLALALGVRRDGAQRALQRYVGAAVMIAAVGAAIDVVSTIQPAIGAALLRFYWFRLSDALVPVGAALGLIGLLVKIAASRPVFSQWCFVFAMLVAAANLAVTLTDRAGDARPGAERQSRVHPFLDQLTDLRTYEDWLGVCRWVADNTRPGSRVLTPPNQQTFKWHAGRAEVVVWKDFPQDAETIVQWWHRYREVYPPSVRKWGLAAHSDERLRELVKTYGVRYIVVDRRRFWRVLDFPRLYPESHDQNSSYEVYWVPREP